MKTPHLIGVNLVHGCTIAGGEKAMDHLKEHLPFSLILDINPETLKAEKPLYLSAIVELNTRLKNALKALDQTTFPIVYGGDHALAIGSISAHTNPHQAVLWIDAHGDCNTPESSISQRIHGMPLAVAQGQGHPLLTQLMDSPIQAQNVLLIGIRSLDIEEEALMKAWGNRFITMETIRQNGLSWLQAEVQTFMQDHPLVHCSFDCDSMDPQLISGVNTPVKGGFTPEEMLPILKTIFKSDHLNALDIVEFNPSLDQGATKALILSITQTLYDEKGFNHDDLHLRD